MATLTGDAAKVAKLAQALGASKSKAESAVSSTVAKSGGSSGSYTYKGADGKTYTATPNADITPAQANAVASNAAYSPISVANMTGVSPNSIVIPKEEPSPYTPIVAMTPVPDTLKDVQDESAKTFQSYIDALSENESDQPSYEAEYAKAERAAGIQQKQELVNQYTLQQNQIVAQQQADILAARNQSSVEGGTAGILSAREDAINRSAAIKILPVQAQLAAAQGNLEMAQERMNTMFDLKMKDAERKYNFKNKLLEATYGFMTEQQKQRADEIKTKNDQDFTMKRDSINYLRDSVITAYKEGNTALASALSNIDENSLDMDSKIASAFKNYGGTGSSIKAPTIQKINGVDMQWEPTTGTWVKPSTSTTTGQDLTQDQMGISSVDDLLNNTVGASTAVGTSFLSRSTGFFGNIGRVILGTLTGAGTGAAAGSVVPGLGTGVGALIGAGVGLIGSLSQTGKQAYSQLTGSEQSFIGSVEQLVSGLTLDSLIKAKAEGATFGALSEGEMNVLSQSATKIGKWARKDSDGNVIGYNIDEKSFKKELQTINNMAKLDYIRKGGKPEDIAVNVTPDGRMWVQNWEGKLEEIRTY